MNRHSKLAVLTLIALLCAACGRLPSEAAGPEVTQNASPFDANASTEQVDIAGIVVTSDDTIVPPAPADEATPRSFDGTDSSSGGASIADIPSDAVDANEEVVESITPEPVQQEDPVVPDGGDTHTVVAGESLSTIAERYGVTTSALQDFNGLSDADVLAEGQVLRVPVR